MTASAIDEQKHVLLTAHPLQRVGAFALCALGEAAGPGQLTAAQFDAAVECMRDHAVRAASVTDTKADGGFWLKASGSFFPNSKMNHPSRLSKRDGLRDAVSQWRQMPPAEVWPEADCALCGRQAVGFYGKVDVALAESVSYRNTVPRGHAGLALCWACLCCFYALPYGCVLTGGPSSVLHSLEDPFLRERVFRQVARNKEYLALGLAPAKSLLTREAVALQQLRTYDRELRAGVDLLVFSNSNRDQSLVVHSLDQPMAEWLRRTSRPSRRAGFTALVRAHRTRQTPGFNGLARNAFRNPGGIVGAAVGYLSRRVEATRAVPDDARDLAQVCRDFARGVLHMNDDDIKQIEVLGDNLAAVIAMDTVRGHLTGLLRAARDTRLLQAQLQTMSAKWLLSPPPDTSGPLLTTRQFRLLFDPDGRSWLYRQLLIVAVLQKLSERDWRPGNAKEQVAELDQELEAQEHIDSRAIDGWDGEQA